MDSNLNQARGVNAAAPQMVPVREQLSDFLGSLMSYNDRLDAVLDKVASRPKDARTGPSRDPTVPEMTPSIELLLGRTRQQLARFEDLVDSLERVL